MQICLCPFVAYTESAGRCRGSKQIRTAAGNQETVLTQEFRCDTCKTSKLLIKTKG